jgi:hypothetical protein
MFAINGYCVLCSILVNSYCLLVATIQILGAADFETSRQVALIQQLLKIQKPLEKRLLYFIVGLNPAALLITSA